MEQSTDGDEQQVSLATVRYDIYSREIYIHAKQTIYILHKISNCTSVYCPEHLRALQKKIRTFVFIQAQADARNITSTSVTT
jgi:hypothetical protein